MNRCHEIEAAKPIHTKGLNGRISQMSRGKSREPTEKELEKALFNEGRTAVHLVRSRT